MSFSKIDEELLKLLEGTSLDNKNGTNLSNLLAVIDTSKTYEPIKNEKIPIFNGKWIRVRKPEEDDQKIQHPSALTIIAITKGKGENNEDVEASFLYDNGQLVSSTDMIDKKYPQTPVESYFIQVPKLIQYSANNPDQLDVPKNNNEKEVIQIVGGFDAQNACFFTQFRNTKNGRPNPLQFCVKFRGKTTVEQTKVEFLVEIFRNTEGKTIQKYIYRKDDITVKVPDFIPFDGIYYIQNVFSGLYVGNVDNKLKQVKQDSKKLNVSDKAKQFRITCPIDDDKFNSDTCKYTIQNVKSGEYFYVEDNGVKFNGTRVMFSTNQGNFKITEYVSEKTQQGTQTYYIQVVKAEKVLPKDNEKYIEVTTNREEERLQIWNLLDDRVSKQTFRFEKVVEEKNKNNN